MLVARIDDLRGRGLISPEAEAELASADVMVGKAAAVGDVTKAAVACMISSGF